MAIQLVGEIGSDQALFEARYGAIHARDLRFDGQFYTAVKSTGIYCRPSCPARTPKRENVEFFETSAAASDAGYRACKRCLPEAVPGTPQWNIRQDVSARAMRLINDGLLDREGVAGVAGALGFSERHLTRTLKSELGVGPLSLARMRRAQVARTLLVSSELTHVDVAFAAGFGSVRQFNDTIQEVFALTPTQIRASRSKNYTSRDLYVEGVESKVRAVVSLELPVRQPFDAFGTFEYLESRAIAGLETASRVSKCEFKYARTLRLPHGNGAALITMKTDNKGSWRIWAEVEVDSLADLPVAVSRLRRLLDLDADAEAIDQALCKVFDFAPVVERTPGMRVHGTVDPAETLIRAIVGQQISVVAAIGHLTRLVATAGEPYTSRFEGLTRIFPTPAAVVEHVPLINLDATLDPDRLLRVPRRQSNTVHTAAKALANAEISLHYGMERSELVASLKRLPGIGEWTAQYVAMRVLNDSDAWLIGDVALIAGAKHLGILNESLGLSKVQEHAYLAQYSARYSPWRAYFAGHLWGAAVNAREVAAHSANRSTVKEQINP